jgi:hypothetical protein
MRYRAKPHVEQIDRKNHLCSGGSDLTAAHQGKRLLDCFSSHLKRAFSSSVFVECFEGRDIVGGVHRSCFAAVPQLLAAHLAVNFVQAQGVTMAILFIRLIGPLCKKENHRTVPSGKRGPGFA